MTVHARLVNPQKTRVFMGTIVDRADVHQSIAEVARANDITTATFELLGGLHKVEFTAYDFEQQMRLEPISFERAMEIVAGHGTISLLDNELHVHLHLALAYRDEQSDTGIRIIGGHAAVALAYAAEFTLTAYDGASVHRSEHQGTGLNLWDLPLLNSK